MKYSIIGYEEATGDCAATCMPIMAYGDRRTGKIYVAPAAPLRWRIAR